MIKSIAAKLVLTLTLILGINMVSNADVIRLVVKEDLASCTGVAPMTCMQVKYKNSKNWELFYSPISGFKYQPGYRYVILVNRTKRTNVPADASAYEYKLKKVLRKVKMKQNTTTAWDFVLKHKWKLIQMNGVTQNDSPVYMTFDGEQKRVSGKSGCNSFFGGYDKSDGKLSFKQMAGTMMACSPELNKLEREFLTLIGDKTFKYDVAEQTLNLYQGNKLVLMFGMAPLK
ncbi:Heat shock protein HslJ [Pedobacter nyackensis]|uniref:Heat shock protein HslJ n=2 Tax=Pedobacter nyackensis TaxID=475255 RepID=A0A1W2CZV9_9SPHI|nr:Heat shock protein HslJ [Pedobacter nyackensis]